MLLFEHIIDISKSDYHYCPFSFPIAFFIIDAIGHIVDNVKAKLKNMLILLISKNIVGGMPSD